MDSAGLGRVLLALLVCAAALALLPSLLRRLQQRRGLGVGSLAGSAPRIVSALALGPQQRVLTVEVGPENARVWLLLGVSAQRISCLHVLSPLTQGSGAASESFDKAISSAADHQEKTSHG